jgi:Tfp pilus assembly protein PilX
MHQRGFSLIVVFLLIIVLVGLAASLMVSTQGDIQVAGQDREAATSFYAAEAGVAFAKDWLTTRPVNTGPGAFSPVFQSGATQLCLTVGGGKPGTLPNPGNIANSPGGRTTLDAARTADYQFCVHNNADDPNYFTNPPNGDTVDGDGILQIEAYGWGPDGTANHISAQVRNGSALQAITDYTCEGGDCGRKGGASESGAIAGNVTAGKSTF